MGQPLHLRVNGHWFDIVHRKTDESPVSKNPGPEAQVQPVRPWPYQFLAITLPVLNPFSVSGLGLSIHEFILDN